MQSTDTAMTAIAFASTFAIRTKLDTKLKLQKSFQANTQSFTIGHTLSMTGRRAGNKGFGKIRANVCRVSTFTDNEKATIISIFKIIEEELKSRIDDFGQDVIISQIELLLNYSNRFYKWQFITRKAVNISNRSYRCIR